MFPYIGGVSCLNVGYATYAKKLETVSHSSLVATRISNRKHEL